MCRLFQLREYNDPSLGNHGTQGSSLCNTFSVLKHISSKNVVKSLPTDTIPYKRLVDSSLISYQSKLKYGTDIMSESSLQTSKEKKLNYSFKILVPKLSNSPFFVLFYF